MRQKIVGILVSVILLVAVGSPVLSTPNATNENAEKIKSINQKISENDAKIKSIEQKKSRLYQDVLSLQRTIVKTNSQLSRSKKNLRFYTGKIKDSQKKLRESQLKYRQKTKAFEARIVAFYKNENLGILQLIFSNADFISIMESTYFLERILETDISLFQDLKTEHVRQKEENKRLAKQLRNIKRLQYQIKEKRGQLARKKTTKLKKQRQLDREIQTYEIETEQLKRSSYEIGALLKTNTVVKSVTGTGTFVRPSKGWISSAFGYRRHPIFKRRRFHSGIDIAAPTGTRIKASDAGIIIFAGRKGGYGKTTIIDHGRSLSTVYGHQSRIIVKRGQPVKQGQLIGYVGSTGYSTGPHLHFEIRKNRKPVNPFSYIKR